MSGQWVDGDVSTVGQPLGFPHSIILVLGLGKGSGQAHVTL